MARSLVVSMLSALAVLLAHATPGLAQRETLLFDHVHLAAPQPEVAAKWYLDHVGGEYIDDRRDRVMIGTTRIQFDEAADAGPSAGSAVDHIGFSFVDLPAKLREMQAAGATVTMEPREAEGLFMIGFVTDPWGVRIELVQDPQHLGLHHVHLRTPDVEGTMQWYLDHVGGVRTPMRAARDAILYPGNVWLMFASGEATPSEGTAIRHIGWRVSDLDAKLAELRAAGASVVEGRRPVVLPNGTVNVAFVAGPGGGRVELVERPRTMR